MAQTIVDALLGTIVNHTHSEIPSAVLIDTRANILATSAATVRFAMANDQADSLGGYELFFANGASWYQLPFRLYVRSGSAPDVGAYQDSSRVGYGIDYISDKRISNSSIGDNANTDVGGIRFNQTTLKFQVYYSGAWQNAVVGFTFDEASDGRLRHTPSGHTETYDVFSGNSQSVGLNGLPISQQFKTDIGAYPDPLLISGGNADMSNPATVVNLLNRQIFRIVPRRMTAAQRAALSQYDTLAGEHVYETDTNDEYVTDGAGNWKKITP